jgi:hypothetical protein
VARLLLPALHPAKADMAEVLDPFEIGHRHTARIGIEVGDDDRALVAQDLVGARRDRTVRGLDDQRRLDPLALPRLMTPSSAAGIRISHSASSTAARRVVGAEGIILHAAMPPIQSRSASTSIPFRPTAPSRSITPTTRQPSSSAQELAA